MKLLLLLGVGGIAYGSLNDEIALTSCEVVGSAEEMPTPKPVVWGTQVNSPVCSLSNLAFSEIYEPT